MLFIAFVYFTIHKTSIFFFFHGYSKKKKLKPEIKRLDIIDNMQDKKRECSLIIKLNQWLKPVKEKELHASLAF